jgi:NodT family efflux transporter outer membrane factor (OMF) lipoprotein
MRRSAFGGLCLVPLLAGCALPPDKPEIALDVPRDYRAARGRAGASPAADWWRGFRSRELSGVMERALASNLDIAAAIARIQQADAQARIAGAPLLPAIDFDASASRSRAAQTTLGGPPLPDRNMYRASLAASYEIDFWGRNRARLRAAESLAAASRFDREVVTLTTMASVANGYFQVLATQDRLRVARQNLTSATRVLNLIRQRLEVGTASALDVAQQESVVATQRAAIPQLEQQLRESMSALAVLTGRPPEFVTIRGGSLASLAVPRVQPGLPSELLTRRPDIREAEAALAAANANVEAARAAFFPTIALTGSAGVQSMALNALFRPESQFYSVAVGLLQPIFDAGLREGQFELERGRQDELLQNYRRTIISGFADVENALVAVRQTAERERLQREVVASSRRAFDIAEQRLNEGTVDLVTVLSTQQALFQAEDALIQAQLNRLLAVVSLVQALGGGWLAEPRITQVNRQ